MNSDRNPRALGYTPGLGQAVTGIHLPPHREASSLMSHIMSRYTRINFCCKEVKLLLLLLLLYNIFLGLGHLFSFSILYMVGTTPWTEDQTVARPLPAHRTAQTQNKRTQYRYPCLEWDSNPRSQRSSERRKLMT
jgi:hypothetical protein